MKRLRLLVLCSVAVLATGCPLYVVDQTERAVEVTLGNMSEDLSGPGLHLRLPYPITQVRDLPVTQFTFPMESPCFSSDLQEVNLTLKVMARIPESSVIPMLRGYKGSVTDSLIIPRVHEATKEVTALRTAADIVKNREEVKLASLTAAREKIGELLVIEDLVIEDVTVSEELTKAIEAKMVQQQAAERALFQKQQATTDAETAIIAAKGKAEAISIEGQALERFPRLVDLKMVEKWNGITPQVTGAGASILLSLDK